MDIQTDTQTERLAVYPRKHSLCNEQFLLYPQCFLLNKIIVSLFVYIFDIISLFAAEFEEPKICLSGKWLTNSHTMKPFDRSGKESF